MVMMVVVVVVGLMRVLMRVVKRLVRLAGTFRASIGETHGDLHRMDRTALGILDPDRDVREPQAGREALQPCPGRTGGNQGAEEHVSADSGGGIDDSETLSGHRLRKLHRATDKANRLRC